MAYGIIEDGDWRLQAIQPQSNVRIGIGLPEPWEFLWSASAPFSNVARNRAASTFVAVPRVSMRGNIVSDGRSTGGASSFSATVPTSTYTFVVAWSPLAASSGGASLFRVTSGALRMEPYSTGGGIYWSATHTGIDTTPSGLLDATSDFATGLYVTVCTYDGSTANTVTRTPAGALVSFAPKTLAMSPGSGTLDLLASGSTGLAMAAMSLVSVSGDRARELAINPWQLFGADNDPVFYSLAGGSNNTATLSSTLDAVTLTGVGAVTRSGTLAVTLDAVTLAGIGTAAVTNKTGTLAVTLDNATLTGIGGVTRSGTLSSTLDAATLSGAGTVAVGTNRDGMLASTLADVTLTGVGAVTRSGTLSVTLDAATLSGIGSVGQPRTGTLSVTLDNVTLRGIGAIPAAPSTGGGKTTGKNLSRKQKKKLKAVESQEWLKAEETARQLLSDRFTKQTPQEKAQALETYIESLQPVIEALKALTSQIEEVVEEAPVIELTPHQEVIQRFDRLEKKVKSVEELIIILMADL